MFRTALFALALSASSAMAMGPSDQLLANVSRELPHYVQDVDANTLRRSQLAAIYAIMHGNGSEGEKRAMIRSTLGGGFSLRGLLLGKGN